ncbi:MAG: HEAT repeat domain-containing protein [Dongiaceae bacterium]
MIKKSKRRYARQPVKYPSVPDKNSEPTRYNEPAQRVKADRMPAGKIKLSPRRSKADLRLRVEELLLRKEGAPEKAWAALGEGARDILVDMLQDEAIHSRDAMLHRLIAVVGQLSIGRGVAPLSGMLQSRSASNLTKAYAANSLGRIGSANAIEALAASVTAKDAMVRRQVAMALGRIGHADALSHLVRLQADSSAAVSEVAVEALRHWEKELGTRFTATRRKTQRTKRRRKIMPAADR